LVAAGSAREAWQMRGLSAAARRLLASVDRSKEPVRAAGPAVRELETRILVHTGQVHTESGRHETALEAWSAWARHAGVERRTSAAAGRRRLEKAAEAIGAPASALPW
jgi:hypothetical protein